MKSLWDDKINKWRTQEPVAKEIGEKILTNNNIAILGKPGSGKSTVSQFLALTFAQEKAGDYKLRRRGILRKRFGINEWFFPFFIPLRDISKFLVENVNGQYDNLIIEAFRQIILPSNLRNIFSDSFILHLLKNKKCIFLLDGLDEVQNSNEFRAVIKEINGLISCFPENKVIVTSRHSGWRGGIGSSFSLFEIEDLNDEDISRFIDNWYEAIEENRARTLTKDESKAHQTYRKEEASKKAFKLKQAMSSTSSLKRIAENPLLLSIICFVHYNKTLPKERLRLYEDCSNLLLVQWDEEKGLAIDDTKLTLTRKEEIIQEIAFSLHTGKIGEAFGRKEVSREEIIPIVEKKLDEFKMDSTQAESLFQKLIDRSGIIVTTERYANRYSFSHLTFQEFYSTKYLYENRLDIFETISDVNDDFTDAINGWWREVVLLYCRNPEDNILQQNLQIAVQCLEESVKNPSQKVREYIIKKLLYIRSRGKLDSTSEQLNPKVKYYLIEFAKSPSFYRYAIANEIIQVDEMGVSDLVQKIALLTHSANKDVRLISIEALEILNSKFKKSQTLVQEDFIGLLNDSDIQIQKTTINLMLNTLQGPLDDTLSIKVFEMLINDIDEEDQLKYLMNNRKINFCELLKALIKISSEKALIEIKIKINELMFRILMNYTPRGTLKVQYACLAESLIQLDSIELKELHKSQLLEALSKGNVNQKIFAIYTLSELYGSENSVIKLIIGELTASHHKIRVETLESLRKLNLDGVESQRLKTYLQKHEMPFSKLKKIQKYVVQILIGKGQIGLTFTEFRIIRGLLNLSEKSEISQKADEFEQKIVEFLRINSNNSVYIDDHYTNITTLSNESIFNLLESHDVNSSEIAFNVLLEKKMI